jgi:hypothetical protein
MGRSDITSLGGSMPSSIPIYPLRLDPKLKASAMDRASKLGLSFNVYVARAIEAYGAWKPPKGVPKGAVFSKMVPIPDDLLNPPSRNSLCKCGSGKKFKRCCGR